MFACLEASPILRFSYMREESEQVRCAIMAKLKITISSNERGAVIEAVEKSVPTLEKGFLKNGDIQIEVDDAVAAVVERKTWEDLRSSITSGHLLDQLGRCLGAPAFLVVEGKERGWGGSPVFRPQKQGGFTRAPLPDSKIQAAIVDLQAAGIRVLRTLDPTDAGRAVAHLARRAAEGRLGVAGLEAALPPASGKRKRDEPSEVHAEMLTCIRGVSGTKARKLLGDNGGSLVSVREAIACGRVVGAGPKLLERMRGVLM